MPSSSQEQQASASAKDKKESGESQFLTPNGVRAGTKVAMTHAERQVFLKNSRIGELLGFSCWSELPKEVQDHESPRDLSGRRSATWANLSRSRGSRKASVILGSRYERLRSPPSMKDFTLLSPVSCLLTFKPGLKS